MTLPIETSIVAYRGDTQKFKLPLIKKYRELIQANTPITSFIATIEPDGGYPEIVIKDITYSENYKYIIVKLLPEDTANAKWVNAKYDIQLTFSPTEIYTLHRGSFTLLKDIGK